MENHAYYYLQATCPDAFAKARAVLIRSASGDITPTAGCPITAHFRSVNGGVPQADLDRLKGLDILMAENRPGLQRLIDLKHGLESQGKESAELSFIHDLTVRHKALHRADLVTILTAPITWPRVKQYITRYVLPQDFAI